ncbi:MAG: HEAT repeat domain-containing protein [Planctomycetes bacterium]|nr:HEAT repeat domain-containing protein [Planctomycetota bacterium]
MRRYLILIVLCLSSVALGSDRYAGGACPSSGGGGSTPGGGPGSGLPSAQRPPLGVGLQPLIQSAQPLLGVADPWEFWWTRNRDKYLYFREPIQWADITDKGGTKSYFISPVYDELISILADGVDDKDPYLAFRAAIALGKAQDPQNPAASNQKAIEVLKKAYESETRDFVRNNVLLGLGLTSDTSTIAIIKNVLQKKDNAPLRRSFAALALSYVANNSEISSALKEILSAEKEDREVKSTCCISLGNLKDASAVTTLGKILNGDGGKKEQGMIRAHAALGLGRIGTKEALDELKKFTQDTEKENDLRSAVIMALGMNGSPDARDTIIEFLQDKANVVRGLACISLAQIKDSKSYDMISEALLKNKSPEADGLMLIALGLTGNDKAKADLRKILSADSRKTRPLLKAAAAIGLGLLKDKDAIEIIVSILKDDKQQYDTILAPYLILSLAMIHDQENKKTTSELSGLEKLEVEILQKMWARVDKNINIVAYTNLAITMMRFTSRNQIIEQLLKHATAKDATLRIYALHTLGLIGNRDSAKAFIDAAKDNNPDVRKAVIGAIGFLLDRNQINPIDKVTADSVDIQMRIMDHILPIPVW